MKTVRIRIPRKGLSSRKAKITVDAEGYTGDACKLATAALEKAIGLASMEETLKEEYYAAEAEPLAEQDV